MACGSSAQLHPLEQQQTTWHAGCQLRLHCGCTGSTCKCRRLLLQHRLPHSARCGAHRWPAAGVPASAQPPMCAHLALGKLDAHGEHVTLALLHRFLDLIVAHAAGTGPGSGKQRQGDSQGGRRRDAGGWRRQPQSERWRSQRRVLTIPHAAPSGLHNTAACKRVQGLPHRAARFSGPALAVQALLMHMWRHAQPILTGTPGPWWAWPPRPASAAPLGGPAGVPLLQRAAGPRRTCC